MIGPASTKIACNTAWCGEGGAGPVAVERPDATAEIQRGKALPGDAAVMLLAQLHAAAAGQAKMTAGGMEALRAQRGDQVD